MVTYALSPSAFEQKTKYLIFGLIKFETDPLVRDEVIQVSSKKSSQDITRLERYFGEVINRVDKEDMTGLEAFLVQACGMTESPSIGW